MGACSTPHPDRPEVLCDKSSPCFGRHANAIEQLSWPGNPVPVTKEPTKKRGGSRKAALLQIAQRVR